MALYWRSEALKHSCHFFPSTCTGSMYSLSFCSYSVWSLRIVESDRLKKGSFEDKEIVLDYACMRSDVSYFSVMHFAREFLFNIIRFLPRRRSSVVALITPTALDAVQV